MIDKLTGKVAYAVMTFGGFLGIGDEYRALPWSVLRYNAELDAYELNATEDQLRYAPVPVTGWETGVVNRDWERNIHDYYRASPYWRLPDWRRDVCEAAISPASPSSV